MPGSPVTFAAPCMKIAIEARKYNDRITRRINKPDAEVLATMPELAEGWRTAFAKMASGDRSEDTSTRLSG
jgi:hypothetical protein